MQTECFYMLDTILSALQKLIYIIFKQHYEVSTTTIPIL